MTKNKLYKLSVLKKSNPFIHKLCSNHALLFRWQHLLTRDPDERAFLAGQGYNYEGTSFYAPK